MKQQMSSALTQGDHTPVVLQGTQEFMNKEIPVIVGGFGEDQKVVTDKMVAEIHNVEAFRIRELINNNIKRFKKDIDIIDLKATIVDNEGLTLLKQLGYTSQQIKVAKNIYLLSERGYAKLIKIMDTDLAWEIHDKLIDEYFKLREAVKQQPKPQVDIKSKEIEARLINAKVRQANTLLKIASTCPALKDDCYHLAIELLSGKKPVVEVRTSEEIEKISRELFPYLYK